MNPAEEIPPEVAHRAYFRQPVWKRVFVIGAGPAVNIALALILLTAYLLIWGTPVSTPTNDVEGLAKGGAAAQRAAGRRPRRRRRRQARRPRGPARPGGDAHVRGGQGRRLQGHDPGRGPDRPRRQGADGLDHADLQRRERAAAARLQLRDQAHVRAGRELRRGGLDQRQPVLDVHARDRRDDRGHLPGRQAQGDLRRRRLLRDDAPGDLAVGRPRGLPARGDLAVARDHQPVPVPAARRRPHLLGAGREGARQARSRSA